MKTTVNIPDELMMRAKQTALKRRMTFTQLLVELLESATCQPHRAKATYRYEPVIFDGQPGLQPGIDPQNWDQIRDIIYEGRGA